MVKFSFVRHVENLLLHNSVLKLTQYLSGSKHMAAIAQLKQKDWPGRQSLIGESSATSSSGPSKFVTFVTSVQSICVRHTTLKKIMPKLRISF
jgi:hypothetical protein